MTRRTCNCRQYCRLPSLIGRRLLYCVLIHLSPRNGLNHKKDTQKECLSWAHKDLSFGHRLPDNSLQAASGIFGTSCENPDRTCRPLVGFLPPNSRPPPPFSAHPVPQPSRYSGPCLRFKSLWVLSHKKRPLTFGEWSFFMGPQGLEPWTT